MWYKRAIIYSLDVKVFYDSNDDGTGDLQGVNQKLDYISSLGCNCIWLLPFFPSPRLDNGYDVKDYYNVDPLLGNLGDFVQLVDEASARGIKIIIDLIVNHTSTEHPWFIDSQKSRDSKYRNYYVWDDDPETERKTGVSGDSIWEFSEPTNSYYLHEYYDHQADLNLANPEVIDEILKIMEFWIRLGVSGFRIDAAHSITSTVDVEHIDFGNLHSLFEKMNDLLKEIKPGAILLGEADVPAGELNRYFFSKKGEPRLNVLFNFISNRYTFLAFAQKRDDALDHLFGMYDDYPGAVWLNYVRHHDELNLKMLSDDEREEVWNAFAPEENMRIFGHGIRRRLPPMLKNDIRRMKLFYALVFGLPGIPLLNYGEEIGMGDDLELKGRESVRTPMQWSSEKNGGFSGASSDKLYRPVISEGDFGYHKVNVRFGQADPGSFLNYMCRLIRMRLQTPSIGEGKLHLPQSVNKNAAGWYFELRGQRVLLVYNLSDEEISTGFGGELADSVLVTLFEDSKYDEEPDIRTIRLHPYGFRWMQILNRNE